MDISGIIPYYQPIPLPAPVWLLQVFLVVGFFLHVLPMNVVLGGTPLSALLVFLGRNNKQSYCYRAGFTLAAALPLFISFAITQGIVPLLFGQLLYGPAMYTSSILIGVLWLSVLVFLVIGYYTAYLVLYRWHKQNKDTRTCLKAPIALFLASLLFVAISYCFATNMTLMLLPKYWLGIYSHSANGMCFYLNNVYF